MEHLGLTIFVGVLTLLGIGFELRQIREAIKDSFPNNESKGFKPITREDLQCGRDDQEGLRLIKEGRKAEFEELQMYVNKTLHSDMAQVQKLKTIARKFEGRLK